MPGPRADQGHVPELGIPPLVVGNRVVAELVTHLVRAYAMLRMAHIRWRGHDPRAADEGREVACRRYAGLIVAQRHAGHHVAPWLLHMTDWELLRLSPIPVLLVKNPRRYRRPVVVAAIDPTHAHAKSAKLDAEILQLGAIVRRALGGTLHAVHASVPVSAIMVADPATGLTISQELSARAASRARAGFDRELRSSGISARRRHLVAGHPAEAIVHVARRTRCAIVLMGAVSRSGLKGLFVGNTAELALDRLGCDVLVTKPPRFANRVPRRVRGPRLAIAVPPP